MHILFTWETPLVNPSPPFHLFTLFTTSFTYFLSSLLYWSLFIFHYSINHFVFCEIGKIDNHSAIGGKVFGWVCTGPRLLKIKRQRSSTFTSLLISKSYWFDKPRFFIEGKLLLATSPPSLGGTTQLFISSNQALFWRRCRGSWSYRKGRLILSITLLCFCLACFIYR